MSARVAGSRNGNQVAIESDCLFTLNDVLDSKASRTVGSMHNPVAAKFLPEQRVISDVILVGQQHCGNAALGLNAFYELCGKTRRVDKDIAALTGRTSDEIAPATKA